MATVPISDLDTGTPQGTDLIPATDTLDTTEAASGTTKKYIRSAVFNYFLAAMGLTTYTSCTAATTLALTVTYDNGVSGVGATLTNAGSQAALTIDGVTLAVNDRVLVKNQSTLAQNGIYTVTDIGSDATNWVLTRATDYNSSSEVVQYGVVLVDQGTINAGLLYQETGAGPFTIGTTDITFALFTVQSISYPVALADGGTSASLTASNGGIFYSTASAGAILAGTGTANQIVLSGINSAPSWSTATYPATTTINQILYSSSANTIAGITAATGGVLVSDSSNVPSWLANPSDTGRFLQSVSGDAPIWSTAGYPTSVGATGTILRSDGTDWVASTATFADTYGASELLYSNTANTVEGLTTANSAMLYTNSSGIPAWSSSLTDGQFMVGNTGSSPAPGTIAAGTGISVGFAANTWTISSTGSGIGWSTDATGTIAADVDNGYICGNAGVTTITLPAACAIGQLVMVEGLGAGGWVLTANTGQTIQIGASATSSGGTLTSAAATDNVGVVCIVANTTWRVQRTNSAGLTVA